MENIYKSMQRRKKNYYEFKIKQNIENRIIAFIIKIMIIILKET